MSLVILSSEQQNMSKTGMTKVEKPNSFTNYFQRPIRVPKNSKVALQSIRFEESKTIQIGISDVLHILVGDELSRVSGSEVFIENTLSFPIVGHLSSLPSLSRSEDLPPGAYSVEDFAVFLQNYFNKFMVHPEFELLTKVDILKNGDVFSGYDIRFDQFGDIFGDLVPNLFRTWIPKSSNFNASNGVIKRTVSKSGGGAVLFDNKCVAIGNEYNLALANGHVDFTWEALGGLYKDFRVGLTRPTTSSLPTPPSFDASKGSSQFNNFYEYCVEMVNETFYVYQLVNDGDNCFMQEINYDSETNSSFTGEEDYPATRAGHKAIRFVVKNDVVDILLVKNDDTTSTLVKPVETDDLSKCPAPIVQTQWNLYPKVELANQNQVMNITRFDSHGLQDYDKRSWYKGCLDGEFGTMGSDNVNFVDLNDQKHIDFIQTRTYKGLNASNGVDVNVTLVVGNNLLYDPNTTEANPNNRVRRLLPAPNVTRLLGFSPFTALDSTLSEAIVITGSQTQFLSIEAPIIIDISKPLLVRLKGLPITTYNGAKSATSQVIYSIGTYNTDTRGVVYVLPPELIYIDIGNTNDLNISQLGIDLVDVLENLRNNMVGKTIITLCIKPKEEIY